MTQQANTKQRKTSDQQHYITLENINELYSQQQYDVINAMEDWQYAVTLNHAMDRAMVNNYRRKCKSNDIIILTAEEKEIINEIRSKYRLDLLEKAFRGGYHA